MSQIELPKVNAYLVTGTPDSDEITIPKINLYAILQPGEGDDGGDTSRQGHVHVQIVRKRT